MRFIKKMNNLSVPKASLEDTYPKLIITGLNSGCWTEVILPVDPNMLNLHSQDQCNDPNDLIGGAEATAFVWTAWLRLDETKSQEAQIHGLASNTVSVNQNKRCCSGNHQIKQQKFNSIENWRGSSKVTINQTLVHRSSNNNWIQQVY